MIYKEIPIREKGSADYAKLCIYIQDRSSEMPYSEKRKLILICLEADIILHQTERRKLLHLK